jgi:hypothetical protein
MSAHKRRAREESIKSAPNDQINDNLVDAHLNTIFPSQCIMKEELNVVLLALVRCLITRIIVFVTTASI